MKNNFTRYRILGWQLFLCSTWEVLCYNLLASMVLKRSAVVWMVFALFVRCHFSCCFWHILSLNLQLSEVWLWCFLVWISLGLCIQSFAQIFKSMYVFFHIWKNFSLSFFSIFENCSAIISPSTFFSADLSLSLFLRFQWHKQLFVALFTFSACFLTAFQLG